MTHNEKRTVWWKEAIFGTVTGIQYGLVQVLIGQPFDTAKTKMQAQDEFKNKNFTQTLKTIFKSDGIKGFYRGGTSIMLGNSLFRGVQFFTFEAIHSRYDPTNLKGIPYENLFTYIIPYTYGLETRTLFAGIMSGICRSIIECPFEFVKVRRQVGIKYSLKEVYHGLYPLILKNSPMVAIGFCLIDIFRRNTNAWNNSLSIFLVTGGCTIFCNIIVWPIEIFRNVYMARNKREVESIRNIIGNAISNHGFYGGIFRGALPGIISIFLRNGIGFVILEKMHKIITMLELRK